MSVFSTTVVYVKNVGYMNVFSTTVVYVKNVGYFNVFSTMVFMVKKSSKITGCKQTGRTSL